MTRDLLGQVTRFGGVGVIGFVVDGGLLYLLLQRQFDPYLARAITFPLAVSVTWYLNRHWTFGIRRLQADRGREYRRYLLIQGLGAVANYAVYCVILWFVVQTPANALAALAVGALVGFAINFAGSRWWAFAESRRAPLTGRYD